MWKDSVAEDTTRVVAGRRETRSELSWKLPSAGGMFAFLALDWAAVQVAGAEESSVALLNCGTCVLYHRSVKQYVSTSVIVA